MAMLVLDLRMVPMMMLVPMKVIVRLKVLVPMKVVALVMRDVPLTFQTVTCLLLLGQLQTHAVACTQYRLAMQL